MAARALTGILLVGGASRRFGSPKALAQFDGETLAERAWRTLGEICDERLAVGKTADHVSLPFELVDDRTNLRAPIVGIVSGLRLATNDLCVVLPVDLPLIRAEDLLKLAGACMDLAVPQRGPLPCAIRRHVLRKLEQRLPGDDLSLRAAFAALDKRVVELPTDRLANVNTTEDLAALGG